jgi:hypothetical protein
VSEKSSILDNQKKELGFLRIKPSLPSGSPLAERGHTGALTLNATALNLDSGGSPGGKEPCVIINLDQTPCWDSESVPVSWHHVFFYHGWTSFQMPPPFFVTDLQI